MIKMLIWNILVSFLNINECVKVDKIFFISVISVLFVNKIFKEYWID